MAASKTAQQPNDFIQCSECGEMYTNPKILPCMHTFCLTCLTSRGSDKKPGQKAACPLCKTEYSVPDKGFEGLPGNFFAQKLLDIQQLPDVPWNKITCDTCDEDGDKDASKNQAVSHCFQCSQNLCEKCLGYHKRIKQTQTHAVFTIGREGVVQLRKNAPSFCDQHSGKVNDLYCADCKNLICVICYAENHSNHKCTGVAKAAEPFCKQLTNDVQKVNEYSMICDKEVGKLEKARNDFITEVSKVKERIMRKVEELKCLIDESGRKLLEKVQVVGDDVLQQIENIQTQVELNKMMMESYKTFATQLKDTGTPYDICRLGDSLQTRAAYLDNIQLDSRFSAVHVELKMFDVQTMLTGAKNIVGELVRSDKESRCRDVQHPFSATQQDVLKAFQAATPKLSGTINSIDCYLTVLNDIVYTMKRGNLIISKYNSTTLQYLGSINMPLSGINVAGQREVYAQNIASCATNNCLYVSTSNFVILHIQLPAQSLTWWQADMAFTYCMTVTRNGTLLVTNKNKISEYTTHGTLVRHIDLTKSGIPQPPTQSSLLPTGEFLVCCAQPAFCTNHTVLLLSGNGTYMNKSQWASYGYGSAMMAVHNGLVFVADCGNHKIQLLTADLSRYRDLITQTDKLQQSPRTLCLDEKTGRLFIGSGNSPIQVYQVLAKK